MALTVAANAITFSDGTSLSSGIITAAQLSAGAVQQSFGNTSGAFNFRNKIINGNFDIWQRGISFTNTANSQQYTADRWWVFGGVGTITSCSRITLSNADLANFYFATRVQRVVANAELNTVACGQIFETAHTIPLAGKTVTVSFFARRGANFSAASSLLQVSIQTGTGTDQTLSQLLNQIWTNYSNSLLPVPLTTNFTRYSVSFTLPANITQAALLFLYNGTGTAGASDFFEITGIQLEEGSVATSFEQRPTALEYALCQRYYEVLGDVSVMFPWSSATQIVRVSQTFKVTKRVNPTLSLGTKFAGTGSLAFVRSDTDGVTWGGSGGSTDVLGYQNNIASAEL